MNDRQHGRMSDSDYERARAQLRETYGDSRPEAANRWEQELALLFHRSGWTLERLAEKKGKGKSWVDRQLRFGRYLMWETSNPTVSPSGGKIQLSVGYADISERAFRSAWDQTDQSDPNEQRRFREVRRLHTDIVAKDKTINPIKKTVRERYLDGKWHRLVTTVNCRYRRGAHCRQLTSSGR
jgi:hypothetical protein